MKLNNKSTELYNRFNDKALLESLSFEIGKSFENQCIALPEDIGKGHTRIINYPGKFRIVNRDFCCHENFHVDYNNRFPENTTVGSITLNGTSTSSLKNLRADLIHRSNRGFWGNLPGEQCTSNLLAGKRSNIIYIGLNQDLINNYPEENRGAGHKMMELFSGRQNGLSDEFKLPGKTFSDLYTILNNPLETRWDWIKFESLMFDIIASFSGECENMKNSSEPIKLNEKDMTKIRYARDILIEKMDNPPTIVKLARMSGVNEFKLKKGFKQMFGSTIYAYLRDYRLDHAKALIRSGEMNVTEAAIFVGYSNPSAFSLAFRKKFGIRPVECRLRIA